MYRDRACKEPMYDEFIRECKKQIAEKHLTQTEVAKTLDRGQSVFNQILNGHCNMLAPWAFRLAKLLNISLDQFTGVKVKKKPGPGSRTGTAINILDSIFERGNPMKWDQYEKLREAITNIKEEQP